MCRPDPQILVAPTKHNFGDTNIGDKSQIELVVSNPGGSELELGNLIWSDNASNEFLLVKDPSNKSIKPGQSISFIAVFAPQTKASKHATLLVPSNDEKNPQVSVTMSGNGASFAEVVVSQQVTDFGKLRKEDQPEMRSLHVASKGMAPLEIGQLGITGAAAEQFELVRDDCSGQSIPPNEARLLQMQFDPSSAKLGKIECDLIIPSNDHNDPVVKHPLIANISEKAPVIEVLPLQVDFKEVSLGDQEVVQIKITNTGPTNLSIKDIVLEQGSDHFQVIAHTGKSIIEPEAFKLFGILFRPGDAGDYRASIAITSNDPKQPRVEITVTGIGDDPKSNQPDIECTPTEVDFGTLDAGQQAEQTFIVRNRNENTVLKVGEVAITGEKTEGYHIVDDFVSNKKITGAVTFRLIFAPIKSGEKYAIISIPSNDPEIPILEIPIAGKANRVDLREIYCNSLRVHDKTAHYYFRRNGTYEASNPKGQCGINHDRHPINKASAYWPVDHCPTGQKAWIIHDGGWELALDPTLANVDTANTKQDKQRSVPELNSVLKKLEMYEIGDSTKPAIKGIYILGDENESKLANNAIRLLQVASRWDIEFRTIVQRKSNPFTKADQVLEKLRPLCKWAGSADFLVIWYTGHGGNVGWLFANYDDIVLDSYALFNTIGAHSRSPHTLIITDGCYSGELTNDLTLWIKSTGKKHLKGGRKITHVHCASKSEKGWGDSGGLTFTLHLCRNLIRKSITIPADVQKRWDLFTNIIRDKSTGVTLKTWGVQWSGVLWPLELPVFRASQHPGLVTVKGPDK